MYFFIFLLETFWQNLLKMWSCDVFSYEGFHYDLGYMFV